MNIDEMNAEIARLQSLVQMESERLRRAGEKALRALVLEEEWRVEWINEGEVRVEKRLTPESAARRQAVIDAHPGMSVWGMTDPTQWNGMTYNITLAMELIGRGGLCVLDDGGFGRSRKVKPSELAALREGVVLESLRYKNRR